jgi:O-succinylhomoserine sulfhydrylase
VLAARQQSGFGGIVSFEVFGGRDAAWQVIDQTQMISITANLGDVKTTITHPGTTTHAKLTDEERAVAGITPGLIRIAAGLESLDDIKEDLLRGLAVQARAAAC